MKSFVKCLFKLWVHNNKKRKQSILNALIISIRRYCIKYQNLTNSHLYDNGYGLFTGNDVKKDMSQVKNKTNWLDKHLINNNINVFMVPY